MYLKFHVNDTLTWNVFKAFENINNAGWFALKMVIVEFYIYNKTIPTISYPLYYFKSKKKP